MADTKETETKETTTKSVRPTKLSVKQLFESKRFNLKYQYDLAKVILGNKLYTAKEAESILEEKFNSKKKKEVKS